MPAGCSHDRSRVSRKASSASPRADRAHERRRRRWHEGFAVFAGVSPEIIRASAREAEALGYGSFWVNHPGPTDGLVSLAHAAAETRRIDLGVGVIPLHTRGPESIADGVRAHGLPLERLLLGVGSPNPGSAQARARRRGRAARASCRRASSSPRSARRCAGSPARWPTACCSTGSRRSTRAAPPSWCARARRRGARPAPRLYAYVRVALGPAGAERLADEGGRYAAIPAYDAHFVRMGVKPVDTAIAATSAEASSARSRPGTAPSTRSSSAPSPGRTRSTRRWRCCGQPGPPSRPRRGFAPFRTSPQQQVAPASRRSNDGDSEALLAQRSTRRPDTAAGATAGGFREAPLRRRFPAGRADRRHGGGRLGRREGHSPPRAARSHQRADRPLRRLPGPIEEAAGRGKPVPVGQVRIRPPLPKPTNIVCMAVNYMEDGTRSEPAPINAFMKSPGAVIGHGDTMVLPDVPATIFEGEAEMALMIGTARPRCRRPRDGARLRLLQLHRRLGARPAARRQHVLPDEVARHLRAHRARTS